MLLLSACQKDDLGEPTPTVGFADAKEDTSNGSECSLYQNFKDAFCYGQFAETEAVPIHIAENWCRDCDIVPLPTPKGELDFRVTDNYLGKEYVVSRSTYWYKRELANSQTPNQKFEVLYRLGDVLLDHNATQSDVAARLGNAGTVSTQSGGGWNIDVSSTYTGEGGLGLFSASDICGYKERETVSLYMEQIGFATVTAYEWTIEDAMTACGGFSCNACIDPICVFNELYNDLAGNPSDQEKVRVAFLEYGVGLSESEVNGLEDSKGLYDLVINYEDFCRMASLSHEAVVNGCFANGTVINEELAYFSAPYITAYNVYYGTAYDADGLEAELQAEGISFCDFLAVTKFLYDEEGPGKTSLTYGSSEQAIPLYLILKGFGEAGMDALMQAFFIWMIDADDTNITFEQSLYQVDAFEVLGAFVTGLLPVNETKQILAQSCVVASAVIIKNAIADYDNYTAEQAIADFSDVFWRIAAEEAIGTAALKYGIVPLGKGIIKKFNFDGGLFGVYLPYKTVCKWFGGGLIENNYGLPACNTCFFNNIISDYDPISVNRVMKGWDNTNELYIIGTVQNRVNAYKEYLEGLTNLSYEIKTISEDLPIDGWSYEFNVEWVRMLKEKGKTVIDIGVHEGGSEGPNYGMEIVEIFN